MGAIARSFGGLIRGWGRHAAGLVLLLFLVLQVFAGSTFDGPRRALFDLYQRAMPRRLDSTPVVIVAIDDASLATVGQWPWPRQIDANLITKILAGHPAALGIDLIWPEPDKQSPEQWIQQAGPLPPAIDAALRELPSHDALLQTALAAGPVMVGLGGVDRGGGQKDSGKLAPIRLLGKDFDPSTILPSFPEALRSIPELDRAAAGHGVLSVDADSDGAFRHLPLISVISGRLAPSLGLEMLRLAAQAPWIDLRLGDHAVLEATVGPVTIPTEPDGSVWIDFSPHDARRFVSAADVLSGRVPADTFDQRLVLIGVTGLGLTDQRMTPLGPMPGTEIHAQLLENIIDGAFARRTPWAAAAEPLLTVVLGLFLIVALPAIRQRWQALAAILPMALLAILGFGLWHQALLLLDVATPMIGQVLVLAALLGGSLAEADAQRRRLRHELEVRRLAAAKADGELAAGRRIQMGILPTAASVVDDRRFDLDALMVPAREIGGDLYDFFKIDEDHLFLAVGDVSGKGVPASLFMALGKSLCKSCALRGETDIGAIVNRANAEISRDNPEMLFITLFAGILNVATGELRFCNAGHDAPLLVRAGTAPQTIEAEGGPPLCVLEDFPYATETCQLQPGDLLCLMTDGVTEAMTGQGALMGRNRVEALLAGIVPHASAKTVIEQLQAAVATFVDGAEASDDLTILTIRWTGSSAP
ncbi:MAG TPA: CHASE2 domain-containing protein [Aliidongia sp.]|uniref:CHASE2 domain-containing protein n=1 Tax=Aliidongia sp. TaxID=1914230 RepID=UPI002DDD88B7|nr:CHASE2 domain-containing protein [Aliidongia sp.]HEV2673141.1 CHASE2 domain-containing protein [Aliidongia sp.]